MASGSKYGNKNNAYMGFIIAPIIWVGMFLLYLMLSLLLPDYKESITWIKDISILLGLIVGGFVFIKKLKKTSIDKIPITNEVTIEFLNVSNSGISLNLYNNLDRSILPHFSWEDVKTIELDYTRDLSTVFSSKSYDYKRIDYITALNDKYPNDGPFSHDSRVYFDKFTLVINRVTGINMKAAYIQIPDSWIIDGTFYELVRAIEFYYGDKIQPFHQYLEPSEYVTEVLEKARSFFIA